MLSTTTCPRKLTSTFTGSAGRDGWETPASPPAFSIAKWTPAWRVLWSASSATLNRFVSTLALTDWSPIYIFPLQEVPNFLRMEAARNPEGHYGIYGSASVNGFGGRDIRNGRNGGSKFGLFNKIPVEEDEGWD